MATQKEAEIAIEACHNNEVCLYSLHSSSFLPFWLSASVLFRFFFSILEKSS